MATINSRDIISRLIENGGYYSKEDTDSPDNPRAEKIVEYTTPEGRRVWGVAFNGEGDVNRYMEASDFVREPIVIWTPADGLILEPSQEVERDRRAQIKEAMGEGESLLEEALGALGLHIDSIETSKEKVARMRRDGKKATLFTMPENASPEFIGAYTMLGLANVEVSLELMKMWNLVGSIMNPKMNAILYARLLQTTNDFVKVGIEMEEVFKFPDAFERNRRILKGYTEMMLAFYDQAWKDRNQGREKAN